MNKCVQYLFHWSIYYFKSNYFFSVGHSILKKHEEQKNYTRVHKKNIDRRAACFVYTTQSVSSDSIDMTAAIIRCKQLQQHRTTKEGNQKQEGSSKIKHSWAYPLNWLCALCVCCFTPVFFFFSRVPCVSSLLFTVFFSFCLLPFVCFAVLLVHSFLLSSKSFCLPFPPTVFPIFLSFSLHFFIQLQCSAKLLDFKRYFSLSAFHFCARFKLSALPVSLTIESRTHIHRYNGTSHSASEHVCVPYVRWSIECCRSSFSILIWYVVRLIFHSVWLSWLLATVSVA